MTSTTKWNKKQSITDFQKNFKIRFDMDEDAIDLRTMAENYKNGIVPLEDISTALSVVSGSNTTTIDLPYDPSKDDAFSPKFAYVAWSELFLMPIFQRDVIGTHIKKIFQAFDHTSVLVPCAVKLTINGKVYYLIWDGHHTLQVMRLRNYQKFPIWYLDIDMIPSAVIEKAGFSTSVEDRIKYAIFRAGNNMRNINSKFKRPLSPYDDFMIGFETGDTTFVAMMNIYKKHKVVPKRHNYGDYVISQHKSAEECYKLVDDRGTPGRYLDRALGFHTRTWKSPITLEIFRPLAYLYQRAETQGIILDSTFDHDLSNLLVNVYGDSESAQEQIKESCKNAVKCGDGRGIIPTHDKQRVTDGFINLYNKKINKVIMPTADYVWDV
jgi:hypothetical protein